MAPMTLRLMQGISTRPATGSQTRPYKRTVVNGFRLFNLTIGPRTDLLRRSNGDFDLIKRISGSLLPEIFHNIIHLSKTPLRLSFVTEHFNIQAQRLHFLDQNVEGFRNSGFKSVIAADNRFINFRTSVNVVGLNRQHFLQRISGAVSLESPNFHFAETLAAKLSLTAQRLKL